jgi:hypothetical protein
MKKLFAFFLVTSLLLAFSVVQAEAKDLAERVGLGYNAQIAFEDYQIAGPSIKYVISPEIVVQGVFAFSNYSNAEDLTVLLFGGKFLYNAIQEDNMNFYAGGGFGVISVSNAVEETGIIVIGCVGEEFFFSGLPNLGFAAEMGLMIASMGDLGTYVGTYGGFLNLGIHYYF